MSGNNLWNVLLCFVKLWNKKKIPLWNLKDKILKTFTKMLLRMTSWFTVKVEMHSHFVCWYRLSSRSFCCQLQMSLTCGDTNPAVNVNTEAQHEHISNYVFPTCFNVATLSANSDEYYQYCRRANYIWKYTAEYEWENDSIIVLIFSFTLLLC